MRDVTEKPFELMLRYQPADISRVAMHIHLRKPSTWIWWASCVFLLAFMNPWWPMPVSYESLIGENWYRLLLLGIALLGPPMGLISIRAAAKQVWKNTDPLHGDVHYAFYPNGISIQGSGERAGRHWDVNDRCNWNEFTKAEELPWAFLFTQKDGRFNLIPKRELDGEDQINALRDWLRRTVPPELRRF